MELVDVDADELVHVHAALAGVALQRGGGAQHVQLQQAQFAVADDEEVAAAAGGVEEGERAQLLVKVEQAVAVALGLVEFGAQFIEEQRADELEDVLFTRVVRAQVAACLGVHDALEQAAEDGGADGRPVERAGVEQGLARGGVEVGNGQLLVEQAAVDVGKSVQLLVKVAVAGGLGRVEHLEQLRQARAGVAAVGRGALFDEGAKALRGEDGRVVGEQAEQQAHQQHFERVAGVAAFLQRVVQAAHALGGLHVHRVLRLDLLRLVAGDEAEPAHMPVQVLQGEADFAARVEVDDAEILEVAHDKGVRQVALGNAGEVAHGLVEGGFERTAGGLLLDQHLAGPEQVDIAFLATVLVDRVLEAGHAPVGDAEDVEEVDPERDGLLLLVGSIGPLAAEGHGAGFDFVPGQGHGRRAGAAPPPGRAAADCNG